MLKNTTAPALVLKNGSPYSQQFEDIYFSTVDGVGESHYNFIQGNDLAKRWQQLQGGRFTVAELGFGTGLNFLLTAESWLQSAASQQAVLHYWTVEKYPITAKVLSQLYHQQGWSYQVMPGLLKDYPSNREGAHQISVHPRIQLTLLWGEAFEQLSQQLFVADAWYLDGFAPGKNPDLWSEALLGLLAKRSRVGTTFATFTAASLVRRRLSSVGFSVSKTKGFGRKRERLIGVLK